MSLLEQLAAEMAALQNKGGVVQKHDFPSGTPSTPYLHGPGGLFGVAGVERDVFSTHVNAAGLASAIPVQRTTETDPLFGYITGFQATTGTQPDPTTDPCGEAPVAGAIKNCIQTARFGKRQFKTRELEINHLGKRINRGEFMDLRVVNSPLVDQLASNIFGTLPPQDALLAGQDLMARFLEVGVAFQRDLGQELYVGTGVGADFPGLETLVGTDKVDALAGTDCPSLDSDVKDFNYSCIGDPNAANDIVRVLTTMARFVGHNAMSMNFGDVNWVWVMNKTLFTEVTDVWPCAYNTFRCASGFEAEAGALSINVDGAAQRAFSDEMRNGRFLRVDGVDMPVIIDDFIPEESAGTPGANLIVGQFASDIYLIPMTVRGGMPVTFWQVFDYRAEALDAIGQGRLSSDFWTDGGNFLWHKKPPLNWCVQWQVKIEPRVILLTPHLAGRLQNVCYEPLQHFRDPVPDDYYFVDGGVSTARAAPSLFSDWNLP